MIVYRTYVARGLDGKTKEPITIEACREIGPDSFTEIDKLKAHLGREAERIVDLMLRHMPDGLTDRVCAELVRRKKVNYIR